MRFGGQQKEIPHPPTKSTLGTANRMNQPLAMHLSVGSSQSVVAVVFENLSGRSCPNAVTE